MLLLPTLQHVFLHVVQALDCVFAFLDYLGQLLVLVAIVCAFIEREVLELILMDVVQWVCRLRGIERVVVAQEVFDAREVVTKSGIRR